MFLTDSYGRLLHIDERLGRGGQAEVYDVVGKPDLAVKLFKSAYRSTAMRRKLEYMIAHRPQDPTAAHNHISIAWPLHLVFDSKSEFAGYVMPLITTDAKELHEVIDSGPFSWKERLWAARNLAGIVKAIHKAGYVIGDFNDRNTLMNYKALPSIIDTDSFQVVDARNNSVFFSPVLSPGFTAPEVQRCKDLSKYRRKPQEDNFTLAILIFQLLMFGAHPYMGVHRYKNQQTSTNDNLLAGDSYLFDSNITVPSNAPSLSALPPNLQQLFTRAFQKGHANPAARPSADEWVIALRNAGESSPPKRPGIHSLTPKDLETLALHASDSRYGNQYFESKNKLRSLYDKQALKNTGEKTLARIDQDWHSAAGHYKQLIARAEAAGAPKGYGDVTDETLALLLLATVSLDGKARVSKQVSQVLTSEVRNCFWMETTFFQSVSDEPAALVAQYVLAPAAIRSSRTTNAPSGGRQTPKLSQGVPPQGGKKKRWVNSKSLPSFMKRLMVAALLCTMVYGYFIFLPSLRGPNLVHRLNDLASGGTLQLEARTYHFSEAVTLAKSVSIIGEGPDLTRIVFSAPGSMLSFEGNGTLTLEGVSLVRQGTLLARAISRVNELLGATLIRRQAALGNVLEVSGGRVEIRNAGISGGVGDRTNVVSGAGLVLAGNARGNIRQSTFERNTVGIDLRDNAEISLSSSLVRDNELFGISFQGRSGGKVEGSQIARNGSHGILVLDESQPQIIVNVIQDNGQRGLSYHGTSGGIAAGNHILQNGYHTSRRSYWQGVGVQQSARPILDGNIVRDNAGVGIQYFDSASGEVRNNVVENNSVNYAVFKHDNNRDEISAGGIVLGMHDANHNPWPTVERNNSCGDNAGRGYVNYQTGIVLEVCPQDFLVAIPDESVTRGELALALYKAFLSQLFEPLCPKDTHRSTMSAFPDVDIEDRAHEAIKCISNRGVVIGFPDGTFRSDETFTRYQIAVVLSRLKDVILESNALLLSGHMGAADKIEMPPDVPEGHWASDAVERVLASGFMQLHSDHTFRGNDPFIEADLEYFLSQFTPSD